MENKLLEEKWRKFLRRVWLFQLVPFVDFVFAAGSLATGNVHENSDCDVIVGVRRGRIFTARFFSVAIFQLLGWRRKNLEHRETAKDKICLNHFVTPKAYELNPPYNIYWQELYQSLVPVLGSVEDINQFFIKNDWLKPRREYKSKDKRHIFENKFLLTQLLETVLATSLGDYLEKRLKEFQIKRIKKGLSKSLGYKPRIIYNDDELEFHPDTRRIEIMLALKNPKVLKKKLKRPPR